ncbi:MAG: ROK family protein [Campylobacterales bacterium]
MSEILPAWLALDIGGTKTAWRLQEGFAQSEGEEPTASFELIPFLRRLKEGHPGLTAIGVSFAGQVEHGEVVSAPSIDCSRFDWDRVRQEGFRVAIDNDLKCAIRAEAAMRPGSKTITTLFVGTGIGSATVYSGQILRGERNLAGEVGHLPWKEAPFRCGCGKTNCLELWGGGAGIARHAALRGASEKTLEALDRSPDAIAREIAAVAYEAIARACAALVLVTNPEVIVLGGSVALKTPGFKERLESLLPSFIPAFALDGLKLEYSTINNAALSGAMILAKEF